MHDSITMAEVGSIVKVSGSRMATPFGPPRPGNTPTKMPSTRPTIIRVSVFQVSRTANPSRSKPKASMGSIPKQGFYRALRHDHVEGDIESDEYGHREHEAGQQRFPQRDPTDHPHEACDQQEACDVDSEPLGEQTKQECRNEHLHHPAQLIAGDEDFAFVQSAYED